MIWLSGVWMSYSLSDKGHKFVIHRPFQRKTVGNCNCYVEKWEERQNKIWQQNQSQRLLCSCVDEPKVWFLCCCFLSAIFASCVNNRTFLQVGIFAPALPYLHVHCSDWTQVFQRSFTDSCLGPTKPKSTSHGLPVQFCRQDLSLLLLLLPTSHFCKLRDQLYSFATCKLVFLLLSFLTYTFVAVIEYWVFKYPSEVVGVIFLQIHCNLKISINPPKNCQCESDIYLSL